MGKEMEKAYNMNMVMMTYYLKGNLLTEKNGTEKPKNIMSMILMNILV